MILKKQEKDNVIKALYDSSNILASVYNKENSDLILIFGKGTQYKYPKVSMTDYMRFEIAESQGKVFNSHIKQYGFEKLDDINPADILKEADDLKGAEKKALLEGKQFKIIKLMNILIDMNKISENGDLFTQTQLEPLQQSISEYITEYITESTKN